MKEEKFIKQNTELWKKLEFTLNKLKSKSIHKFNKEELDEFFDMYNLTCGHLSFSRTYYGNNSITSYLNRLVSSAHGYIYTTKPSGIKALVNFLLIEFPLIIRTKINFILLAAFFFLLGTGISFIFTAISVDNAIAFLPKHQVEAIMGTDVNGPREAWDNAVMSSTILTNNIRVGILAFTMGVTLGIGSFVILYMNGYALGGLAALFFHKKANLLFWSLILPHGVIELIAIFICGGAGIIIGYSLINPGIYSRKDSFIIQGKTALKLVLGTIPLFIVAGIIEGYLTPSGFLPEVAKLGFALLTLLLIIVYIVIPNMKYKLKDKIHI
jgi:uncharacterized membrane protein SpoIIM required for sporulation